MTDGSSNAHALLLVVERDPHVRRLERYFLEQAGFGVDFADDGEQGLSRARAELPEIVIAEILLPRVDGLAVCRALKSSPETASILVVLFSILSARGRASEAGADAFIRKPLDADVLIATVKELLDDLLDVSRIVTGKIELRSRQVLLGAVVEEGVELCRPLIDARRHTIDVSLPDEEIWVLVDPERIVQIVGNLVNNAAKYTEPGGCIRISAEREDAEAVLRVEDDGAGIPADLLPNVFDLFTQGDRTLDRAQGGLGIGLTLVRRLAELHGGSAEARSGGAGLGSEFTVRLPMVEATRVVAPEAPARGPAPASPMRVLVVEDNADAADMLAELLRQQGHTAEIAGDGKTALEAVSRMCPDVALVDIGLPGMDGYEVARRVRAACPNGPPLLVAVTGYGQEDDRRRAVEAGFSHHIVKPVGLDDIAQVLAAAA